MPTVRVRNNVNTDLIRLCAQIQLIKKKRTSPSAAISLLLRFAKNNQQIFDTFIEKERERLFPGDYGNKIETMQNSGLPTTQEITHK